MNGIVSRALTALGAAGIVALWAPVVFAGDDCSQPEDDCPPQPPPRRPPPPPPAPPRPFAHPPRHVITYVEQTPNSDLISAGALMFGLSYGTSLVIGATSDRPSDQNLVVPLAGPWMALATRGPCVGGTECVIGESTSKVLLAADGILQTAGALQVLAGFLFPQTTIVTRTASQPQVHVAPTAGLRSVGLTAWGSF